MADQRDIARERARDVLQQRAAAAAARAAPATAVAAEPTPPPQPEPEDEAEQPEAVLESPPPMPVPDPPADDAEGSYTVSGTTESDEDGDPGSDTITASADVGYSVNLKFPESPPDGSESGPSDSEAPVPEEPKLEEPPPPPAILPTPTEQPTVATGADPPSAPGIDPTVPQQAADAGPVLPEPARPTFVREVRLDPVRERLEAAAENIQLPGHSGPGLAEEVTQRADVLRETGVAPGKRPPRASDDADQREEGASLDIFAARFALKHAEEARGVGFGPTASRADAGHSRYGDESERQPAAAANEGSGAPSEIIPAAILPPGFRTGEPAPDTRQERHFEPSQVPPEPDLAVPKPRDAFEPEEDDWALHRTRLSLIDSPAYADQDRDALPHELPEPVEIPWESDD